MSGMLKDVVDSIFTPTTKPQAGVVKAMNYSFYALFATLAGLAYATSWNNHVLALSGVAVLLFASISWFIAELGKIEEKSPSSKSDDTSSSSGSSDSKPSNANTKTERNTAAARGNQSYAEVAAEPPSSSTTTNGASTSTSSAVVDNNDRSGLTERKTRSSGAPQSSSTSTSAANSNGNGNGKHDGASYAEVAAEEPTSSSPSSNDNAIKANRVGVVEAAGMSYINKPSSSSPRTSSSSSNTTTGGTKAGQETYAEAAAEDFDESASVVREDRVGHTENK